MRNRSKISSFLLLAMAALSCSHGPKGDPISLKDDSWAWTPAPVAVEKLSPEKVAVHSGDGDVLSVGPWIAGKTDVRLVYQGSLPLREGSVCGQFRTEDLYPREANVWISFKVGEKTLAEQNYWLGVSHGWTSFCFPVFAPPPECTGIELSFGFHMKTHGRLYVKDLVFSSPLHLKHIDPTPRLTRPDPPESLASGAYVSIQEHDGVWWLVAPDGNPFYSLATSFYNNRNPAEENGPVLEEMGFNSISTGISLKDWVHYNDELISQGKKPFYMYRVLNIGVGRRCDSLMDSEAALANDPEAVAKVGTDVGGFNHTFPDPFDPRWEAAVRDRVRETVELMGDKPYFMGWMADNERSHWNLYRYVWSPHCAVEFDKFLRTRYDNSIAALNAAWNRNYESFGDILAQRPEPLVIEGDMYEDFNDFSRYILKTFNDKLIAIIREYDPGRLVFSNRFMIHEVRGVFDNLDLYSGFDAIAVNLFPSNEVWGLDLGEMQYFELMHELTGKPLIMTEWSIPARDSGLYDNWERLDWSFPQLMRSQKERAQQLKYIMADWYNMPFMVGSQWFNWSDFDSRTRRSNRGIFKPDGEPWPEVKDALNEMNHRLGTGSE